MHKLAIMMIAGLFAAAPAFAEHGTGCTATDAFDIAGTFYAHVSGADGFEYYYLESGAQGGLQPGGVAPVWGWDEGTDFSGCSEAAMDILLY